jgi:hypothetical protein
MGDLKQTLDIALKKMDDLLRENADEFIKYWSSPQREFEWAVLSLAKGDPKRFIEYLRSDRPILFDRQRLAILLEQAQTPRGGPLHHRGMHSVAGVALHLYKMWHEENIRHGINDRGRSNYMKDEAARIVLDQELVRQREPLPQHEIMRDTDAVFGRALPDEKLTADDLSAIRDLMDRPAKRLKIRSP